MSKVCPKCGTSMAPTYILVKVDNKLVRQLHAWICPKCSYVIPAPFHSTPS